MSLNRSLPLSTMSASNEAAAAAGAQASSGPSSGAYSHLKFNEGAISLWFSKMTSQLEADGYIDVVEDPIAPTKEEVKALLSVKQNEQEEEEFARVLLEYAMKAEKTTPNSASSSKDGESKDVKDAREKKLRDEQKKKVIRDYRDLKKSMSGASSSSGVSGAPRMEQVQSQSQTQTAPISNQHNSLTKIPIH